MSQLIDQEGHAICKSALASAVKPESLNEEATDDNSAEKKECLKDEKVAASPSPSVQQQETALVTKRATSSSSVYDAARKAGTAVVGGSMVSLGVGLVIIPFPISIPVGVVVAGAGMSFLGREFPAAQKVLVTTKEKLVDAIEKKVDAVEEDGQLCIVERTGSEEEDVSVKEVHRFDPAEYSGYNDVANFFSQVASKVGRRVLPVIKSINVSNSNAADAHGEAADGKREDPSKHPWFYVSPIKDT